MLVLDFQNEWKQIKSVKWVCFVDLREDISEKKPAWNALLSYENLENVCKIVYSNSNITHEWDIGTI